MTTKRKPAVTADIAVLKSLVQEQTLKIADLEKKLADAVKAKETADLGAKTARDERDAVQGIVNNAHDLMDACPAALPRTKKFKPYTWSDETRDEPMDLLVRMGSWLGATK